MKDQVENKMILPISDFDKIGKMLWNKNNVCAIIDIIDGKFNDVEAQIS